MLQTSERGLACSAFYSWNETAIKSSYGAFYQRYFSYKVLNLLQLFFLSVSLIFNSRIKSFGGLYFTTADTDIFMPEQLRALAGWVKKAVGQS